MNTIKGLLCKKGINLQFAYEFLKFYKLSSCFHFSSYIFAPFTFERNCSFHIFIIIFFYNYTITFSGGTVFRIIISNKKCSFIQRKNMHRYIKKHLNLSQNLLNIFLRHSPILDCLLYFQLPYMRISTLVTDDRLRMQSLYLSSRPLLIDHIQNLETIKLSSTHMFFYCTTY